MDKMEKQKTNAYTICLLFDETASNVLLQRKDHTAYEGLLNGVGGKMNRKESVLQAIVRTVNAETGLGISERDAHGRMSHVCTLRLPSNCAEGNGAKCVLYVYAARLTVDEQKRVCTQPERERLEWHPVTRFLLPNAERETVSQLAGDGSVLYFVNQAIRRLEY